jgi:hypothetical protein
MCGGGVVGGGGTMDERVGKVSGLLHEAGETHHQVFRITEGADDDWASWSSDWLVNHSELPELLGRPPVRSQLTWMLVQLDMDYTANDPGEKWEDWYAEALVRHLGAPNRQPPSGRAGSSRP